MHILLSNDDGVHAIGLKVLAKHMQQLGDITVVAPDRDRSGASNSLTIRSPLRTKTLDDGFISVEGTPTDCVHLAVTGLLESDPDMVVSGINAGANLGDDVLYSGTVAAATEGRFLGLPAIAVSLASEACKHYTTAAEVVKQIIVRLQSHPLPADTILNVNVPDVPIKDIAGFEVTRLGARHGSEPTVHTEDPRGRPIHWIGPPGPEADAGQGTDFHAVRENRVSLTPLHIDLTHYRAMKPLAQWVNGLTL